MVGKISRKTEILRNVTRHKFDEYFQSQKVYYVKNFLILVKRFNKRLVQFLKQFSLFLFHIFITKCFENCLSLPFKTFTYRLIFFHFFLERNINANSGRVMMVLKLLQFKSWKQYSPDGISALLLWNEFAFIREKIISYFCGFILEICSRWDVNSLNYG